MEMGNALRRTRKWRRAKSAHGYERIGIPDDAMAECPWAVE